MNLVVSSRASFPGAERLTRKHLTKKALVYVRQSTLHQLRHNQESRRLQYGLRHKVEELGFVPEQIEVIDEDQGRSGASAWGREGFQRILSEVALCQVGLVMSLESSRLSRSNLDWQRLVELCGMRGVLLGDQERLYDPRDANDQLLLGLKGSLSQFELHVLKQRMDQGKLQKAQRGELRMRLPSGYVYTPAGKLEFDPDELVRQRVRLVLEQFEMLGSARAVVSFLYTEGLRLPYREPSGPRKGQVSWRQANTSQVNRMLRNPFYAGMYVYGKERMVLELRKAEQPYSGRKRVEPEHWLVRLQDHHQGYISQEQYQRNQEQLSANRPVGLGAARSGPSLLSGLVRCGRCGKKMLVSYKNNGRELRYECILANLKKSAPRCQSMLGRPLEEAVERMLLQVLEPASLELSMMAVEQMQHQRTELHQNKLGELEQARYQAQLAQERYQSVDSRNRRVARSVEKAWEESLARVEQLKAQYEEFCRQSPQKLSVEEKDKIRRLSSDIPKLWHSERTRPEQRQQLLRLVLQQVEVRLEGNTEKLSVRLNWHGGEKTELQLVRPVQKLEQMSFYEPMVAELTEQMGLGATDSQIADRFQSRGYHSARGHQFDASHVGRLRRKLGLLRERGGSPRSSP